MHVGFFSAKVFQFDRLIAGRPYIRRRVGLYLEWCERYGFIERGGQKVIFGWGCYNRRFTI